MAHCEPVSKLSGVLYRQGNLPLVVQGELARRLHQIDIFCGINFNSCVE